MSKHLRYHHNGKFRKTHPKIVIQIPTTQSFRRRAFLPITSLLSLPVITISHTSICNRRASILFYFANIIMATSVVASSSLMSLKPSNFASPAPAARARLLPSLARSTSSFRVEASGVKKIKTDKPYGTGGGMQLRNGVDASGRKPTGKGVYQYVDKYGANVDGYSPIYNTDEWSPTGDVYVGGTTGLAIWAVTLLGLLAGGALLVYNTSALAQ